VLTVSAVRARVSAAIASRLAASGWRPSRYIAEPIGSDARSILHQSYQVTAPRTSYDSPIESSPRRASTGGLVKTELVVSWLYRLRGDAQVSDYDDGLDAEQELMLAVQSTSSDDLHLHLTNYTRAVVGDGEWLRGQFGVVVTHRIRVV
jgi:hypothetical protein